MAFPIIPIIAGAVGGMIGVKILSLLSPKDVQKAQDTLDHPKEAYEQKLDSANQYFEDAAKDPCRPKD